MAAAQVVPGKTKFWIGFLGGLTPYALSFATFCVTSLTSESLVDLITALGLVIALGKAVGVSILSAVGGLLSYIWDPKEKDLRRLFIIGMAAPAILFSTYSNIEKSIERSKFNLKNKDSSRISSYRDGPVPQIDLQRYLSIDDQQHVRSDYTVLPNFEWNHVNGGRTSSALMLITHQADHLSQEGQIGVGNLIRTFFEAMFLTVGVREVNTTLAIIFILSSIFAVIFLVYRARMEKKTGEMLSIFREHLARADPDLKALQGKIKEAGLTVEEAAALLEKGDNLNKGLAALGERKFDEAIERFTEAVREVSDAFFYRAFACAEIKNYQNAIEDYDKFLEFNPTNGAAWANRGAALGNLGRYEESLASHDKALELNPTNALAWTNRGVALANLGRHEEALASHNKALELNPTDALAWTNRGAALANLGRHEEAFASHNKALEHDPDNSSALNNQAWLLIDQAIDIDRGIESARKALELSPDNPNYEDTLGWGLYKKGRYQEALVLLQKAASKLPNDSDITKHLHEVMSQSTSSG